MKQKDFCFFDDRLSRRFEKKTHQVIVLTFLFLGHVEAWGDTGMCAGRGEEGSYRDVCGRGEEGSYITLI